MSAPKKKRLGSQRRSLNPNVQEKSETSDKPMSPPLLAEGRQRADANADLSKGTGSAQSETSDRKKNLGNKEKQQFKDDTTKSSHKPIDKVEDITTQTLDTLDVKNETIDKFLERNVTSAFQESEEAGSDLVLDDESLSTLTKAVSQNVDIQDTNMDSISDLPLKVESEKYFAQIASTEEGVLSEKDLAQGIPDIFGGTILAGVTEEGTCPVRLTESEKINILESRDHNNKHDTEDRAGPMEKPVSLDTDKSALPTAKPRKMGSSRRKKVINFEQLQDQDNEMVVEGNASTVLETTNLSNVVNTPDINVSVSTNEITYEEEDQKEINVSPKANVEETHEESDAVSYLSEISEFESSPFENVLVKMKAEGDQMEEANRVDEQLAYLHDLSEISFESANGKSLIDGVSIVHGQVYREKKQDETVNLSDELLPKNEESFHFSQSVNSTLFSDPPDVSVKDVKVKIVEMEEGSSQLTSNDSVLHHDKTAKDCTIEESLNTAAAAIAQEPINESDPPKERFDFDFYANEEDKLSLTKDGSESSSENISSTKDEPVQSVFSALQELMPSIEGMLHLNQDDVLNISTTTESVLANKNESGLAQAVDERQITSLSVTETLEDNKNSELKTEDVNNYDLFGIQSEPLMSYIDEVSTNSSDPYKKEEIKLTHEQPVDQKNDVSLEPESLLNDHIEDEIVPLTSPFPDITESMNDTTLSCDMQNKKVEVVSTPDVKEIQDESVLEEQSSKTHKNNKDQGAGQDEMDIASIQVHTESMEAVGETTETGSILSESPLPLKEQINVHGLVFSSDHKDLKPKAKPTDETGIVETEEISDTKQSAEQLVANKIPGESFENVQRRDVEVNAPNIDPRHGPGQRKFGSSRRSKARKDDNEVTSVYKEDALYTENEHLPLSVDVQIGAQSEPVKEENIKTDNPVDDGGTNDKVELDKMKEKLLAEACIFDLDENMEDEIKQTEQSEAVKEKNIKADTVDAAETNDNVELDLMKEKIIAEANILDLDENEEDEIKEKVQSEPVKEENIKADNPVDAAETNDKVELDQMKEKLLAEANILDLDENVEDEIKQKGQSEPVKEENIKADNPVDAAETNDKVEVDQMKEKILAEANILDLDENVEDEIKQTEQTEPVKEENIKADNPVDAAETNDEVELDQMKEKILAEANIFGLNENVSTVMEGGIKPKTEQWTSNESVISEVDKDLPQQKENGITVQIPHTEDTHNTLATSQPDITVIVGDGTAVDSQHIGSRRKLGSSRRIKQRRQDNNDLNVKEMDIKTEMAMDDDIPATVPDDLDSETLQAVEPLITNDESLKSRDVTALQTEQIADDDVSNITVSQVLDKEFLEQTVIHSQPGPAEPEENTGQSEVNTESYALKQAIHVHQLTYLSDSETHEEIDTPSLQPKQQVLEETLGVPSENSKLINMEVNTSDSDAHSGLRRKLGSSRRAKGRKSEVILSDSSDASKDNEDTSQPLEFVEACPAEEVSRDFVSELETESKNQDTFSKSEDTELMSLSDKDQRVVSNQEKEIQNIQKEIPEVEVESFTIKDLKDKGLMQPTTLPCDIDVDNTSSSIVAESEEIVSTEVDNTTQSFVMSTEVTTKEQEGTEVMGVSETRAELQINSEQKRRKMGSTRRSRLNRKQQDEEKNAEESATVEASTEKKDNAPTVSEDAQILSSDIFVNQSKATPAALPVKNLQQIEESTEQEATQKDKEKISQTKTEFVEDVDNGAAATQTLQPIGGEAIQPSSPGKRRKMGSTRKNLSSKRESSQVESVTPVNSEKEEVASISNENESQENSGLLVNTAAVHQPPLDEDAPLKQQVCQEKMRAESKEAELSLQHEAMTEDAVVARRRKMGSHRKPHSEQSIREGKDSGESVLQPLGENRAKPSGPTHISEVNEGDNKASSSATIFNTSLNSRPVSANISQQPSLQSTNVRRVQQSNIRISSGLDHSARRYEVVMIGDSSVGKTSFIQRAQSGKFSPDVPASIGMDSYKWTMVVNGKSIVLQLWDTAGQERFRSMTKQIFHRAQAFLLMYDVTCAQTFTAVSYWANCIKDGAADNVVVLLLGNKCDHTERKVRREEGEILAEENNFAFMECSAATGENVMEALETVARLLSQKADRSEEPLVLRKPEPKNKLGCC